MTQERESDEMTLVEEITGILDGAVEDKFIVPVNLENLLHRVEYIESKLGIESRASV